MPVKYLKRLKLSFQFYNFFHKSSLIYNTKLYKKYNLNKKYYSSISNSDFKNIEVAKTNSILSEIELQQSETFKLFDEQTKNQLLEWPKRGYVILKNFYSDTEIDKINNELDKLIKKKKVVWRYNRIIFPHKCSTAIKNAGTNKKLISILNLLLNKKVELFQSLSFSKGSNQKTHSDSIHMTTFPLGNLVAVWIALEDITLKNGPLHYYPSSHKLPTILNEDFNNQGSKLMLGNKSYSDYEKRIEQVVIDNRLKKEIFLAKKGDLLIWHANLLHGGEPIIDKNSTRKSLVFHYFAKDVICYHEITQRPALKTF